MRNLSMMGMAAALAAAVALWHPNAAMAADDKAAERTVSVSATGTVTAEPDLAYITAGMATEADTAREALARNNAAMAKVIDGLKAAGIAARDIQTSTLAVEARYTQAKDGRPAAIAGYRARNQVRLTVRDVKRLGEVLDIAVSLGANQVGGINFDVADAERLKDEARKQAMANARRRAELYAAAAGVQLGAVLRIAENIEDLRPVAVAPRASFAAATPIEPGSRTLTVEVHVTYALR